MTVFLRHLLSAFALSCTALASEPAAKAVTEKIDLFEVIRQGAIHYHLNPLIDEPDTPEKIFQMKEDGLHISGKGFGYLSTNTAFKDYHLILEFRWTGPTSGRRADRARDNGILVHCHGPAGSVSNTWAAGIEAQLIEGGMGDILVLNATSPSVTKLKSSVEAEYVLDRDKEKRWKKGASKSLVTSGRINWEKRDEDWADQVNYRGKNDLDAKVGEWNKLEIIARGDTLQYFFNGKVVNEAFAVKPAEGPIAIQTEGAGLQVRRYELLPLKQE